MNYKYPLYFKCISSHSDKGMIVQFTSLYRGKLVKEAPDGLHKKGKFSNWKEHTDTSVWEQVDYEVDTMFGGI